MKSITNKQTKNRLKKIPKKIIPRTKFCLIQTKMDSKKLNKMSYKNLTLKKISEQQKENQIIKQIKKNFKINNKNSKKNSTLFN